MSKFKIINLFDKLFITVSVFLIIYAWINFYIRNLWTTFFLSLIFTFGCVFLLFYLIEKKQAKKSISKDHQKLIDEKFLAFRLMRKSEQLHLLKSIESNNGSTQILDETLVIKTENENYQITVATHIEKLTQFQLVNILQNVDKNIDVLKIICNDYDSNLNTSLIKNLKIEFITKALFFENYFVKKNAYLDSSNISIQIERKRFREIMKNFFISSKAKSYFCCGLILIFSSIILPFHTYYLIVGTILLLFAIICKLDPFRKS